MHLVVIAWLYVALMMAVAEATNTNGTVSIVLYIGNNGMATIPDTINGLPVTSLADSSFLNCSNF